MLRSAGWNLAIHGAPSRVCRLAVALRLVNSDAVGCQKARSGLSPDATFVWPPCSYGSGMVTTWTLAPVAAWKSLITFLATVLLFCAAQMVSVVPFSLAVSLGQPAGPLFPLSRGPDLGLLRAARPSDAPRDPTRAAAAPSLFRIG